jgi:hypothetical protein
MTDLQLLTPAETAQRLGVRPATLEVWRCEKIHKLPYIKIGGRVMYKLEDLLAFIESRRVDPGARKAQILTKPLRNHQRKGRARNAS